MNGVPPNSPPFTPQREDPWRDFWRFGPAQWVLEGQPTFRQPLVPSTPTCCRLAAGRQPLSSSTPHHACGSRAMPALKERTMHHRRLHPPLRLPGCEVTPCPPKRSSRHPAIVSALHISVFQIKRFRFYAWESFVRGVPARKAWH